MNTRLAVLLLVLLNFYWAAGVQAEDPSPQSVKSNPSGDGFYFDSKSRRFFTNGNTAFSIRPIGPQPFLEKVEVSVDESPFKPYSGRLKFSKEGLHIVRFKARDPVLNWSPTQIFRIFVDLDTPKSQAYWEGQAHKRGQTLYVHPQSQLVIGVQDNLSGVSQLYWKSSEKAKAKLFKGKRNFAKVGPHKIFYASQDNVGNLERWKEISFVVENSSPVSKANVKGAHYQKGTSLFVNSGTQIHFDSKDDGAGLQRIEYQVEGKAILTYSHPVIISGNKMRVKYRGVDWIGNKEKWKEIVVFQDSTPPVVGIKKMGKHVNLYGKTFARPGFGLKAQVRDAQSGVKNIVAKQNGQQEKNNPLRNFEFKKPGEHHFALWAYDHVGNVAESATQTIVIDETPPQSTAKPTEKFVKKDGVYLTALPNRLEIRSSDAGVGLDHVEISYDGKSFFRLKDSIDLATWSKSFRTVYFRGVDRLGNQEPVQKMQVRVLNKAPQVDLFVESDKHPSVPLSNILKGKTIKRLPAGVKIKTKK